MAGTYLFGWDSVNSKWVKLVCDADGKLKIDPTLILENPPTEDLATKAASSEWSYDHWKNASAHHAKFTAAEARASIGNIFGSDGHADNQINMSHFGFTYLSNIIFRANPLHTHYTQWTALDSSQNIGIRSFCSGVGYQSSDLFRYNGAVYEILSSEVIVTLKS